jgi:hypothetical protein
MVFSKWMAFADKPANRTTPTTNKGMSFFIFFPIYNYILLLFKTTVCIKKMEYQKKEKKRG